MSKTARLNLPMLSPGQAQKEIYHNEALQALDTVVAASVEEPPRDAPPTSPSLGSCYIVGASPTGAWSGKSDFIACFTAGGWRFTAPIHGMQAFVRSLSLTAEFRADVWEIGAIRGSNLIVEGQQVVGPRLAAIAAPTGGSTIDGEARACIAAILLALQEHGLIDS